MAKGHWEWTADGKRVWVGPKKDDDNNNNNNNTGGGGSSNGNTSGGGSSGDAEKKRMEQLLLQWKRLFPTKKYPPIPHGLIADTKKYKYSDAAGLLDWVRKNTPGVYMRTAQAIGRGRDAKDFLSSVFGDQKKITAAFVKKYIMGDPRVWSMDRFIEEKVVKSKAFRKEYGAWDEFIKQPQNRHKSYKNLIAQYNAGVESYRQYYQAILGGTADVPKDILNKAITENWSQQTFEQWVMQNDPAYLTTGGAKTRDEQFVNFWHTIYGADSQVNKDMQNAFVRGTDKIEDFFNSKMRNTKEFKDKNPWFEDWAKGQMGDVEEGDLAVDPMAYFQDLQKWKQLYEVMTETPGAYNEELIRQALIGNWSEARFQMEFQKTDPAYTGTSQALGKKESFAKYWKNLFGTDAEPDKAMMDEFQRGNSSDPSSMFEQIKTTDLFKAQYAGWEEYAKAQSESGIGGEIIDNPSSYLQYQKSFQDAFARMGVILPEAMPKMIFASGMDDSEIENNLQTWITASPAMQQWTGEKPTLESTLGLKDKTAGGALRIKMQKALEQHKNYTASRFNTFRRDQKSGNQTLKI